jgi:hypothetical protein
MKWNLRAPSKQFLIGYLVIAVLVMTSIPADVQAMFLPTSVNPTQDDSSLNRQQILEKLQRLLESKLISQRLSDLGFSQGEILPRLNQLSDQQVHFFASNLESLQTGGDGLGIIIALLVIAILVVVLLQLSGHKVIITK